MYGNNFFFKGFNTLSSRTSTAWSVKSFSSSDIMDRYIKIIPQKKKPPDDATNLHVERIARLRRCLEEGKNVFIYGACGTGKTFLREQVLNESNSIELTTDLLRSKSIFRELIQGSKKHLFIEDYEPDALILKGAVEQVSDGRRLTDGSLVVVSTHMCMYPNFEFLSIPRHSPDEMARVVPGKFDRDAAVRARGNIRDYVHYLEGCDDKDVFESPKEIIHKVLCDENYALDIRRLSEHGHMWSIFQENYLDSKDVDYVRAALSFSEADKFDCAMYSGDGDWNMMPFFANAAISIPRFHMRAPLKKEALRPGSCWTKLGNYKMRRRKLSDIQRRNENISIDALCLLQTYAGLGYVHKLLEYDITPQDFDTMNHLCIASKLKPRDVNSIKKRLKNARLHEQGN
jgi:hypothetical protein